MNAVVSPKAGGVVCEEEELVILLSGGLLRDVRQCAVCLRLLLA